MVVIESIMIVKQAAMTILEIITIGREILDLLIDTNSVVRRSPKPIGLAAYAQKVDDHVERIVEAFRIAARRSQLIVVTGGLGPTSDDLTAKAFGQFLGEPLALHEHALTQIKAYFARAGREISESQRKQAYLPQSCSLLENSAGTAPGFARETPPAAWYFMPDVPHEMKRMLQEQVLPRIRNHCTDLGESRSMTWATQFTSEGGLQEKLTPVEKRLPAGYELTYRTRFPENHIGLYATGSPKIEANAFVAFCDEVTRVLGAGVFSIGA